MVTVVPAASVAACGNIRRPVRRGPGTRPRAGRQPGRRRAAAGVGAWMASWWRLDTHSPYTARAQAVPGPPRGEVGMLLCPSVLGLGPGAAGGHGDLQRHPQPVDALHLAPDQLGQ